MAILPPGSEFQTFIVLGKIECVTVFAGVDNSMISLSARLCYSVRLSCLTGICNEITSAENGEHRCWGDICIPKNLGR